MRWVSYLFLALRRLVSWSSSAAFIEWKVGVLLLLMMVIPAIIAISWILDLYYISPNTYPYVIIVVLPLLFLSQKVLARFPPGKHAKEFEALPRARRVAVYGVVVLLVVLVFALPFIVRQLELGHP